MSRPFSAGRSQEGMPVHRHVHDKRGSVYALSEELDEWIRSRRLPVDELEKKPEAEIAPAATKGHGPNGARRSRLGLFWPLFLASAWHLPGGSSGGAQLLRLHRGFGRWPCYRCGTCQGIQRRNTSPTASREAQFGRLSNIHDLRVISHTTVTRFKSPKLSVPEIAKELGEWMLSSRVRSSEKAIAFVSRLS